MSGVAIIVVVGLKLHLRPNAVLVTGQALISLEWNIRLPEELS